jgi:hypothetical protein
MAEPLKGKKDMISYLRKELDKKDKNAVRNTPIFYEEDVASAVEWLKAYIMARGEMHTKLGNIEKAEGLRLAYLSIDEAFPDVLEKEHITDDHYPITEEEFKAYKVKEKEEKG